MITEKDLQEAIAECQGKRNPDANTCLKLASYYTIQDHLQNNDTPKERIPSYSYAAENLKQVEYDGDSEFAQIIKGKDMTQVLSVIDELMDTLGIINPRLHDGVIARLS